MKIVFFGSDDFAAVHLKALLKSSYTIVGCVTQPDRPQGRGMKMVISLIKEIALDANIPYLQPANFKEQGTLNALKDFDADIFVVVAYGRLLTQAVLDIPRIFCVNVHGSLLPAYRGAAPINWAIMNGESQTGVTIQKMALQLDAGDIISQKTIPITATTSSDRLREEMSHVGATLLIETLDAIAAKKFQCLKQDEAQVTYAHKLSKEMSTIHWKEDALIIDRRIRGLKPWPGSSTTFNGKMLKVHEVTVVKQFQGKPGVVLSISKEGVCVACGAGAVLMTTVQPEAGKYMSAYDFAQGHQLVVGSILG